MVDRATFALPGCLPRRMATVLAGASLLPLLAGREVRGRDARARLSSLGAPTVDIDRILAEIEARRT